MSIDVDVLSIYFDICFNTHYITPTQSTLMKRKICALCKMKRTETKLVKKYGYWFCKDFSVVSGGECRNHPEVKVLKKINKLKNSFKILTIP